MKTIQDVEEQAEVPIGAVLRELDLLPEGYRCSVRLHAESRKKKRTALFEKNWHPDSDSIKIKFVRSSEPQEAQPRPGAQSTRGIAQGPNATVPVADPLADLIRALARAETRPGYKFVSLKWFRDTALPSAGFSWAAADSTRKNLLGEAINQKLILTNSVPNPNSPFPTTAIRLNRLMPEVQAILGIESNSLPDFAPVPIRGESLSATVLRDRR